MVDTQSATADIRRGKKQERRKKQDKNIMAASATQAAIKKLKPGLVAFYDTGGFFMGKI